MSTAMAALLAECDRWDLGARTNSRAAVSTMLARSYDSAELWWISLSLCTRGVPSRLSAKLSSPPIAAQPVPETDTRIAGRERSPIAWRNSHRSSRHGCGTQPPLNQARNAIQLPHGAPPAEPRWAWRAFAAQRRAVARVGVRLMPRVDGFARKHYAPQVGSELDIGAATTNFTQRIARPPRLLPALILYSANINANSFTRAMNACSQRRSLPRAIWHSARRARQ